MPRWIVTMVLAAWPPAARWRHGRSLAQTLEAAWREAGRAGVFSRFSQRTALVLDAIAAGLAERRATGRHTRMTPGSHRRSRPVLRNAAGDCRHAWRRLRVRPGSALVAAGMLAAAVGLTAAMFTVVDALVLRPVPFRDPDRLVAPRLGTSGRYVTRTARDVARAWRASPGFEAVHGVLPIRAVIEGGPEPLLRGGALVTPGTFEMLGVAPITGRSFAPGDGRAGTFDLALISEETWRSDFAADPTIIGRRLQLSGHTVRVIGVMPAGFRFPLYDTQVWQPLDLDAPPPAHAAASLLPTARIAAGVPREDAARLAADAMHAADPALARYEVVFRPLTSGFLDAYSRRALLVLMAGAALVFLALCANVANLLLARLTARAHEFGVCSALGASRGRLLREALLEHAIVGVSGSAAGLAFAALLVALARHYLPEAFLVRTLNPLDLDLRAAGAAGLLGLAATMVAGAVPAWLGSRPAAGAALRVQERGATTARGPLRASRTLLAAEIVLTVTILAGAGTLLRSFLNLAAADRGLDTTGVIAGLVNLPGFAFADDAARRTFGVALDAELRRLPGVTSATVSQGLPPSAAFLFFGEWQSDAPGLPAQNLEINVYAVEPDFFGFFGIHLREGRLFSSAEPPEAVIIDRALARRLWPDEPAIGRWFGQDGPNEFQVIGVVDEIRSFLLDPTRDKYEMFRPTRVVVDGELTARASSSLNFAVRCGPCPPLETIRRRVHAVSARAVVQQIRPMDEDYLEALARPRAAAALAVTFGGTAMLAAAGGLFSILSYAVTRRRRELGIRAAMGAGPAQLRRLVIVDGLRLAAVGAALGAIPAWSAKRALSSLAYRVSSGDPLTWASVSGLLGLTVLAATWHPARRAMRTNPVKLLTEN